MFVATVRSEVLSPTAVTARALAILRGCELATSLRLSRVIIESNSQEMISSLSTSLDNGSWEAFPTLTVVKRLEESL